MSQKIIGCLFVLIATILWGTTGTAASFIHPAAPFAVGAASMAGGGLLQALFAGHSLTQSKTFIKKEKGIFLSSVLCVFIYPLSFYASMAYAGVSIGTVISMGLPCIFSGLIEHYVDHIPLSKKWFLEVILGLAGIILLSYPGLISMMGAVKDSSFLWGILLAIIAAFTYAFFSWGAGHMMHKGCDTKPVMGSIFGGGAVLLLPIIIYYFPHYIRSYHNMAFILYMIIGPMFLGYIFFGKGLARIDAATAMLITLCEPVTAIILSIFILNETLTLLSWLGIIFMTLCLLITFLPDKNPKNTSHSERLWKRVDAK